MITYVVSLHSGSHQAIIEADTQEAAEIYARWEYGNSNVDYVRPASPDEIDWTKAMGGAVETIEAG